MNKKTAISYLCIMMDCIMLYLCVSSSNEILRNLCLISAGVFVCMYFVFYFLGMRELTARNDKRGEKARRQVMQYIAICKWIPFLGLLLAWVLKHLISERSVDEEEQITEVMNASIETTGYFIDKGMEYNNRRIQEERQKRAEQEELEAERRAQREEQLRKDLYNKTGDRSAVFNSDGSYMKRPGGEWVKTSISMI